MKCAAVPPQWLITDHVCQVCFGRVLKRRMPDVDGIVQESWMYRCADCAIEGEGTHPNVICSCGIKVKGRKFGVKCEKNDKKSPEWPVEIVAKQA